MSKNAAYSAAARQAVINFLREEAGYKPFQASKFVKSGSDILPHVYLAKSRHLTQIYVGIIPLYLPSATTKLNAICLTGRYPDCVLSDLDSESQTARWVSAVVNSLRDGAVLSQE